MDYKIDAIKILLNEDCILSRYFPLIPYKVQIIEFAKKSNIKTKNELSEMDTINVFNDESLNNLFKRFLVMYDNEYKLRFLSKLNLDNNRLSAYKELFLLPGVKETRAELYYLSGYKNLLSIANSTSEKILEDVQKVIIDNNLSLKLPLDKEIKTHIAVANAFTL
ncbi:MAG: hypothetical protein MJ221_03700 [Bacilli bacterium]|nr:hypothetical protein [Bacilli bacterium]